MSSLERGLDLALICRARDYDCALPLAVVIEIMRPLPVAPVAGAPSFVRGMAVIRGKPMPVVDAARLLGSDGADVRRFVTLRTSSGPVALAVEAVLGVRRLAEGVLASLPPLLQGAPAEVVDSIGALDSALLVVLSGSRLLPQELLGGAELEGSA